MTRLVILIALVWSLPAWATTYYVNASTGNNTNTCVQAQSTSTPKATITAGKGCMAAGDTLVIYGGAGSAGDYTAEGVITIPAGSAIAGYSIFQAHGTDVVKVFGLITSTYTKVLGNCPTPTAASAPAWGSCGFSVGSSGAPTGQICIAIGSVNHVYVRNTVSQSCGTSGGSMVGQNFASTVSYVFIAGNTISYGGVAAGVQHVTTSTFSSGVQSISVPDIGAAVAGWNVSGPGITGTTQSAVHIQSITGTGPYTITFDSTNNNENCADPSTGNSRYPCITFAAETNAQVTLAPQVLNSTAIAGDHVLIENNDFSHYSAAILDVASHTVVRNNFFHDQYEYEGYGNAHTDIWFAEPGGSGAFPVEYNVVEGNIQRQVVGPNAKGILSQNDSPLSTHCNGNCFNLIERFNIYSRIGGGIISNDSPYPGWPNMKSYNNDYADVNFENLPGAGGGADVENSATAQLPSSLNNIYYWTSSANNQTPVQCQTSTSPTNYGCNLGNSLLWCVSPATCTNIYSHTQGVGTFTGDPGNINVDPKFVSYVSPGNAANDYHLASGSGAIGKGIYLTTVDPTDTGTGTTLIVTDTSYFQDGSGLTNDYSTVSADCIAVGTVTNHVCITAVVDATHLTLASSISRSSGQGVYLYSKSDGVQVLTGSAPDIGALGTGIAHSPAGVLLNSVLSPGITTH